MSWVRREARGGARAVSRAGWGGGGWVVFRSFWKEWNGEMRWWVGCDVGRG